MKTIVLALCAAAFVVVQGEVTEETKKMAEENKRCFEESKLTLEALDTLINRPSMDLPKSSMCYIKCVAEEGGIEKEGIIEKEAAVAKRPQGLSKESAEQIITECGKLVSDESCKTSFLRYSCVVEKSGRTDWLKPQ